MGRRIGSETWSMRVKVTGYLVMAIFTVGVLELTSYYYLMAFEGYDGAHLITYEFDDYKNIRPTPGYVNTKGIYHNAQGFRERNDTNREKKPEIYRIFVMGGSTAYGLGSLSAYGREKYGIIRNNETIDAYLESYLNGKLGRRVEVINAAITSHYSHHHLIYLNQTILKYHPDMVVFIDGFNDYYPYEKGFDQFEDYAYQERIHAFMDEPSLRAFVGYTGWWLFRKSHFIHVFAKTLRPWWIWTNRIGADRPSIDMEESLKNLEENGKNNFVKMVERNGLILAHEHVRAVFALQPEIVLKQSKALSPLERQIFEEMDGHWQENFVEYKNRALPIVRNLLKQATQVTGAIFADLTDPFQGLDDDAYTDYCHLTPAGNKRVAESLGNIIAPIIVGPSQ